MLREFEIHFRGAVVGLAMAATLGAMALAGCGVKGPLKPAPPTPAAAGTPTPESTPAPTTPERKP